MSTVYAIETSSCPMMDSMSHTMMTEDSKLDDKQEMGSTMSCCGDVVMQENIECCDSNCKCSISGVSFSPLPNVIIKSLKPKHPSIVSYQLKQTSDVFLNPAQRPPILFIS